MKRALIDPATRMVMEVCAAGSEFPVAPPFFWAEVPDTAVPHESVLAGDGTLADIVRVKQVALATVDFGSAAATLYAFTAGEGLPEHTHTDRGHATQVLRGRVRVERGGAESVLDAGMQTTFRINEPHAIVALSDALIVNITDSGEAA